MSTLVFVASLLSASAAGAQNYASLRLEAGRAAFLSNNYEQAIVELKLASIGLLEEPPRYAQCKSLLFLAQLGAHSRDSATATLMLIANLEQRFTAYTKAPLLPNLRQAFESTVVDNYGDERFSLTPRFEAIIAQARAQAAAEQPPSPAAIVSIAELKRRAREAPQDQGLQETLTVRLYRAQKVADALDAAERLASIAPNNTTALCVGATVGAARNRSLCPKLSPAIAQCPEDLRTSLYIETRLRCSIESKNWKEGLDYLSTLTPDARAKAKIEGLVRRIDKHAQSPTESRSEPSAETTAAEKVTIGTATETPPESPAPADSLPEQASPRQPASSTTSAEPQPVLTKSQQARIGAIRTSQRTALAARNRTSLIATLATAQTFADENPGLFEPQKLTGEIAYLLKEWRITIDYLDRAQQIEDIGTTHLFYLAVAHFETGETELADTLLAESLRRGLVRTSMVDEYDRKIRHQAP